MKKVTLLSILILSGCVCNTNVSGDAGQTGKVNNYHANFEASNTCSAQANFFTEIFNTVNQQQ